MIWVLLVTFFTVTFISSLVIILLHNKYNTTRRDIERRVEHFSKEDQPKPAEIQTQIFKSNKLSEIPSFNRFLSRMNLSKKLTQLLEHAGSSMKVGELLLRMGVFGIVGFTLGLLIHHVLIRWILLVVCGSFPLIQVFIDKVKRFRAFVQAFPDSLDMMTSAIRAGHAFNQALQLVGEEATEPVSTEFKKTFEQYNLGVNLRDALLNLTTRLDSLDLKLFVTAILLQRETGGNLAEILEKISYTIRERFKLIGQIKTFTAQGRMSAWILGMLPIIFVLIISALNPGYLEPLFHDKLGHGLIVIASILQIVGFSFIRKIVEIKYE